MARNYDSGLYHFAAIRWSNEYAVVPGLANLHVRLGFNQSYFLWVALLNVYPFFNEGYHVANSLLLAVLVSQLIGAAAEVVRSPAKATAATLLPCLLLPVCVFKAVSFDISSPTPDLAVFVCGMIVFILLVRNMNPSVRDSAEYLYDFTTAVLLSIAGCTIKLSFAAFAAAAIVTMLIMAARSSRWREWTVAYRISIWIPVGAIAWGGLHVAHGVILSGYPAFPAKMFGWPVDWRVPLGKTQETANAIYAWARAPGPYYLKALKSSAWMGPWWHSLLATHEIAMALILTGAGLALIGAGLVRQVQATRILICQILPLAPLCFGLVVWFVTAPDPRFADWLIWLFATYVLAHGFLLYQPLNGGAVLRAAAVVTVLAACGIILVQLALFPERFGRGFAEIPKIPSKTFVTNSGLKLLIPADKSEYRLWDAPLPTTPYGQRELQLRGITLAQGFRVHEASGLSQGTQP